MSAQRPVTLVTGAASGIGLAIARLCARRGQRVVAWDRDEARLRESMARLEAEVSTRVYVQVVDVSDAARVGEAVEGIERGVGAIVGLAHAAGVLRMGSALALELDAWNACLATNTGGVVHVTRAVAARMSRRARGSIVVIASNAAHTPRLDMAAYAASKAAALMFVRCLGLEVARYGVRCNVVCPGSTDTPMQRAFWGEHSGPEQTIRGDLSRHRLGIPLGRIAQPEDVAESALFLLSDAARQITLQRLTVDGGATL